MEATPIGLIAAGGVVLITIGAVVVNQRMKQKDKEENHSRRRSDGTGFDIYDSKNGEWYFVPNKGGKRKSRRK